ncbi:uncharacterized protein EV422DRAFT_621860 [Fimicolochytrium jonesii]|uniref:uncharacterized protein n=1 Tax=Fimicolochytrium jonesii TaxID=1396493 RepID=UPI0022FEFCB5|nr:uncharacterized protein EV422DRAFT_621860 [Fimicolochytrium jonesii]KAI8818328.1 putative secreted protein [Fimicolochytrium jonesii]
MRSVLEITAALLLVVVAGVRSAPVAAAPKPFVLAILPDTQHYSESYPEIFTSQTQWIVDNLAKQNILFVIHEGDVTNRNTDSQWKRGLKSMSVLDGKVPYSVLPGNHDIGFLGLTGSRDTSGLNKHFPVSKLSKQPGFGGVFEANRIDNNYFTFSAEGTDYLLLFLEFGPRDAVLQWASRIIAANPTRRVIVTSHAHTYFDNTLQGSKSSHVSNPESYGIGSGANNGQKVWDKLIRKHPNILMVLNGHMHNGVDGGYGRLTGTGDAGNKVFQMLADYQDGVKGGNGFLRLLTFDAAARKISVTTYSPYVNQFKTDAGNQFEYNDVELGPLTRQRAPRVATRAAAA